MLFRQCKAKNLESRFFVEWPSEFLNDTGISFLQTFSWTFVLQSRDPRINDDEYPKRLVEKPRKITRNAWKRSHENHYHFKRRLHNLFNPVRTIADLWTFEPLNNSSSKRKTRKRTWPNVNIVTNHLDTQKFPVGAEIYQLMPRVGYVSHFSFGTNSEFETPPVAQALSSHTSLFVWTCSKPIFHPFFFLFFFLCWFSLRLLCWVIFSFCFCCCYILCLRLGICPGTLKKTEETRVWVERGFFVLGSFSVVTTNCDCFKTTFGLQFTFCTFQLLYDPFLY